MEQLNHQKRSGVQAEADFLPQLERGSRISLEKQLVWAIREAIESGRLHPGMRLPSSRRLAAALQVNRKTHGMRNESDAGVIVEEGVQAAPNRTWPSSEEAGRA